MNKFELGKRTALVGGVCSGIANYTGIDVTVIRIGTVVATILGVGSLILVYIAIWIIAAARRSDA